MVEEYEAVVYDLDGTLVQLAVDWIAVGEQIKPIIRNHGGNAEPDDALDLLPIAESVGAGEEVDALIAAAEREGARQSKRLPLMDEFLACDMPVGICSFNCEAACHDALEAHDAGKGVEVVSGRDSVSERKPHPKALLAVIDKLGTAPERTLFVGDSESDEETAHRAGTPFRWVK